MYKNRFFTIVSLLVYVLCTVMFCDSCKNVNADAISVKKNILNQRCGGINDLLESNIRKGSLIGDDGEDLGEYIDTVKMNYSIFKPCRTLVYDANFIDDTKNIKISSDLFLKLMGEMWSFSPKSQQKAVFGFSFSEMDKENYLSSIGQNYDHSGNWISSEITGVISTDKRLWMHPFRSNQFEMLQMAPYPEIKFPLYIGRSWSTTLSIGEGWGEWEYQEVYSDYTISEKDLTLTIPYGELNNCWKITAESNFSTNKSSLDIYYNETYGFVRLDYITYLGQKIEMNLKEVID